MKHEAVNSATETPNYIAWDKLSEDNESFKTDFEETPIENDFAEEFETKTPEVEMTEDNTEAIETEPETTTNSIEQSSSPETETNPSRPISMPSNATAKMFSLASSSAGKRLLRHKNPNSIPNEKSPIRLSPKSKKFRQNMTKLT